MGGASGGINRRTVWRCKIASMKCKQNCIAAVLFGAALAPAALARQYFVYVGTYTNEKSKSKGIYSFRFDSTSGEMTPPTLAAEVANPSFLTIHPNRKFLYAVSELAKGEVTSYAIDPKTGALTRLNSVPAGGSVTCH